MTKQIEDEARALTSRLFRQGLQESNWKPRVLAVDPKFGNIEIVGYEGDTIGRRLVMRNLFPGECSDCFESFGVGEGFCISNDLTVKDCAEGAGVFGMCCKACFENDEFNQLIQCWE